jgi:hypothetical protein
MIGGRRAALLRPTFIRPGSLYSFPKDLDNAAWTKSNTTVTANQFVAPDGTSTGDGFVNTGSDNIAQNITVVVPGIYTMVAYLRSSTQWMRMNQECSGSGTQFWFDVQNGAVGSNALFGGEVWTILGHSISAAPNGWWRCSCTARATAFSGSAAHCVRTSLANTDTARAAPGTVYGVWGVQLHPG